MWVPIDGVGIGKWGGAGTVGGLDGLKNILRKNEELE